MPSWRWPNAMAGMTSLAKDANYTNGIMVAQVAVETIRRAKAKGKKITRATLYEELLAMNGFNAY